MTPLANYRRATPTIFETSSNAAALAARAAAAAVALLLAAPAHAQVGTPSTTPAVWSSAPALPVLTPYLIKQDDTLYKLANQYLQSHDDWKLLRRINHVPDPRHLRTGATLMMPTARLLQQPLSATVVAVRGVVQKDAGRGESMPLRPGVLLEEGDEVRTGRDAFVSMVLSDGSHLVLPSSSIIEFKRLRKTVLSGTLDRLFALKRGEANAEVTPLKLPSDTFRISSPSVVAGVRGTRFRVDYLADRDATAVEVLNGKVGVDAAAAARNAPVPVGGQAGSETLVTAGYGDVTATGSSVGARVKLLDAPTLLDPAKLQSAARVSFDLAPVPAAQGYRTEIAADADFLDVLRDQRSSGTHVSFDGLPEGYYFVRISATSAAGIDGLSEVYTFDHRLDRTDAAAAPVGATGYAFRWHVDGALAQVRFRFILSSRPDLGAPLVDQLDVPAGHVTVSELPPGRYYWTIIGDTLEDGRVVSRATVIRSFNQVR